MRHGLAITGVAAVALLAAGCFWPAPGAGPDRDAHNASEDEITAATVGDLEELWRTDVAPTSWTVGQPVTSNGNVHVTATDRILLDGDEGSVLAAVDRDTGGSSWSSPIGSPPVAVGSPIFADDAIWLGHLSGAVDGSVELFDPDTGDALPPPAGAQGLVNGMRGDRYLVTLPNVPTASGLAHRVAVQDLTDPSGGWDGNIDTVPAGQPADYSPLTLGNDHVFQAGPGTFWDGSAPGSGFSRGNGIRGYSTDDPVDDCAPGEPAPFICPTWSTELDGTTATSPVLAPGASGTDDAVVYTGTDAGTVYALDATDGDILWSTNPGGGVGAEPALANGILFVPTDDHLTALDADTGGWLWETILIDPVVFQPAVAGDVVFAVARETVEAFPAGDCSSFCNSLWSVTITGGPGLELVAAAPAVDRGQLYIGTRHGRVIAYGLP